MTTNPQDQWDPNPQHPRRWNAYIGTIWIGAAIKAEDAAALLAGRAGHIQWGLSGETRTLNV